jgi:hypothetical protein
MTHITKIAAVETTTAIWEYDPTLPDNRVLNGSLDVIAAIRTIAIKVSFCSIFYYFFSPLIQFATDSIIRPAYRSVREITNRMQPQDTSS